MPPAYSTSVALTPTSKSWLCVGNTPQAAKIEDTQ